ncbi:MAG: Ig-like domain repeat protein [Xanthobacteraceae bacterium]
MANYTPDANSTGVFNGSASNTVTITVNNAATNTTTNLSASPTTVQINQPVTLTATVAPAGGSGTPTGTVAFIDSSNGGSTLGSGTLTTAGSRQQVTITVSFTAAGTHTIVANYTPDANSTGVFNGSASNTVTVTVTTQTATTTTLTSTPNPSAVGQAVTFTATVTAASGAAAPTGIVTFKDGSTTIGTVTLPASGGTSAQASFTTSALTAGSHSITAAYNGAATFTASTSAILVQTVSSSSDSTKLREMQVSTTPVIAQAWGSTVSSAIGDAITAGLSGGTPQALSPNGTGFTYYFDGDPATQHSAENDQDTLKRYLASPDGSINPNQRRVDEDFAALGYAGSMPTKAPPPAVASGAPREWLAWISLRGTDYYRPTFGDDLKGEQVDMLAGLTRRITPDFVVGLFAGYETFDYTSQAFDGTLTGDGWTAGGYLGWRLAGSLRFDLGGAWSGLSANDTAGTANGNFTGTRWLTSAGLTGTYNWQSLLLEPSARVFALWEHENAYTDSLGTLQAARDFSTGRASVGAKVAYPMAWTSSVALAPYAGLYADYFFSQDDAQTVGLTTVPLLQGFAARVTGGISAKFAGGASISTGGEFGGIGLDTHFWTWTARGSIPF